MTGQRDLSGSSCGSLGKGGGSAMARKWERSCQILDTLMAGFGDHLCDKGEENILADFQIVTMVFPRLVILRHCINQLALVLPNKSP